MTVIVIGPKYARFIPMDGPHAHANLTTRSVSAIAPKATPSNVCSTVFAEGQILNPGYFWAPERRRYLSCIAFQEAMSGTAGAVALTRRLPSV